MRGFRRVDEAEGRRYSRGTSDQRRGGMRLGRGSLLALILTGALGGIGFVAAQDAATGEETDTDETGEIAARRRADLSPAEQIAEAQRIQERGTTLSRRVGSMLDEARREGDVIRVTCLDDKLTQINAHRRTLTDRVESLQTASQVGDEGRRNHEFTVISVLAQNLDQLERAASECIGQDIYETGATRITTTIDPATPDEDPTVIPEVPEADVPFIPPPASPTI
ncbi:hypothetical protein [Sandaracinus amylolyticus]|nr:hypothetical protein [Sandaracinus amylolyticus]